ncbi:MAG: hypothetical protein WC876_03755 [Candidatus Thermoplasmatota archaeon]|jgi:hypothetical protein
MKSSLSEAEDGSPLLVHWAVARDAGPDYVDLPMAVRVVQVGLKPGWPRVGDWYKFACGKSWIAVPAHFVGTRLVDSAGNGNWSYTWCQKCQADLPAGMPRHDTDWGPR